MTKKPKVGDKVQFETNEWTWDKTKPIGDNNRPTMTGPIRKRCGTIIEEELDGNCIVESNMDRFRLSIGELEMADQRSMYEIGRLMAEQRAKSVTFKPSGPGDFYCGTEWNLLAAEAFSSIKSPDQIQQLVSGAVDFVLKLKEMDEENYEVKK